MNVRFACALAFASIAVLCASARGQGTPAAWSPQQQQEFQTWLQAEQRWREWMADNRNFVTHNWMGMEGRDWLGRRLDRKERPAAPAWLGEYCDNLTPPELDDHARCQQYESLKNYDWKMEAFRQQYEQSRSDNVERTHFDLKQHWGFGLGYDNRAVHGSLGMQLTVAEWGRWNYGTLGASVGFMKHPSVEHQTQTTKSDLSLFLTLASASYRIKYVESFGMFWYVDFAQIYDVNHNMTGSQFGFSLSKK